MISVCVTVKNRSRVIAKGRELRLFPRCVASVREALRGWSCELVVADWHSDDWPLDEWLEHQASPIPVTVLEINGVFCRGQGLNAAARAARGDILFFIDADALLSTDVIALCADAVDRGSVAFPVLYTFNSPDERRGRWCHDGFGHCMIARNTFELVGGWPEYRSWGREDDDFHAKAAAVRSIWREEVPGFFHQWHPHDVAWKNRYYSEEPDMLRAQRDALSALEQLRSAAATDAPFIVMDEQLLDPDMIGHDLLPFLERDGAFFGNPVDDEHAISELERMRSMGASHLVVLAPAFWWFEHYRGFAAHIAAQYACIACDERMRAFDLRRA